MEGKAGKVTIYYMDGSMEIITYDFLSVSSYSGGYLKMQYVDTPGEVLIPLTACKKVIEEPTPKESSHTSAAHKTESAAKALFS